MAVEYVGSGNDDGADMGRATTSKIGFYGLTTPIVQPTVTLGLGTDTITLKADMLSIVTQLAALGLITAG